MAATSLKDKDVGKTFGIGCAVSCFVDEREVCTGYVTAFDNYYKTLAIRILCIIIIMIELVNGWVDSNYIVWCLFLDW